MSLARAHPPVRTSARTHASRTRTRIHCIPLGMRGRAGDELGNDWLQRFTWPACTTFDEVITAWYEGTSTPPRPPFRAMESKFKAEWRPGKLTKRYLRVQTFIHEVERVASGVVSSSPSFRSRLERVKVLMAEHQQTIAPLTKSHQLSFVRYRDLYSTGCDPEGYLARVGLCDELSS